MKKKFALSAAMAVFFLCASACGGGGVSPSSSGNDSLSDSSSAAGSSASSSGEPAATYCDVYPVEYSEVANQPDMEAFFLHAADEVRREAGSAHYADFELEHERLLNSWDEFKAEVDQVVAQSGRIRAALSLLGGPVNMYELGYSKDEALNALLYAKNIRTRFGLLRLLDRWGVLKPLATEVMEDMYDK